MAKVPGESLPPKGAKIGKIHEGGRDIYFIKDRIKVYFIYWIAVVLAIELLSAALYSQPNYTLFWYPLLTQLQVLVLLVAFLTHGKVLNFCSSKMTALWAFCGYYAWGIICLIFQINGQIYSYITDGILLSVFVVFIYNLIKNK